MAAFITRLLPADPAGIAAAVSLLRQGQIVGVPTETVYGLAALAHHDGAVAAIFEAKERPAFDPLIVHLAEPDQLDVVVAMPAASRAWLDRLIQRFWPGPLTLVLPKKPGISDLATSGLQTVAVRCTAHPVLQAIIRTAGPIAAPSANRFGRISPTTAQAVEDELSGRLPLILDGGPCEHGVESTIIRLSTGGLELLRPGPVTLEELQSVAPVVQRQRDVSESLDAPGALPQHYAPLKPLALQSLDTPLPLPPGQCGVLAWQSVPEPLANQLAAVRILSTQGEPREAAANLFRYLRELDASPACQLVAEPVPEAGLGLAIMDRLRRASAGSGGMSHE